MTFSDVGGVHSGNIDDLAAVGVVSGFEDGTFRPAEPVSRGQVASLLARVLDVASPGWRPTDGYYVEGTLADPANFGVSAGQPYYDTVGVTSGDEATFVGDGATPYVEVP